MKPRWLSPEKLLATLILAAFCFSKLESKPFNLPQTIKCDGNIFVYVNETVADRSPYIFVEIKADNLQDCINKCFGNQFCYSLKYDESNADSCSLYYFAAYNCTGQQLVAASSLSYKGGSITIDCLKCPSNGDFVTAPPFTSFTEQTITAVGPSGEKLSEHPLANEIAHNIDSKLKPTTTAIPPSGHSTAIVDLHVDDATEASTTSQSNEEGSTTIAQVVQSTTSSEESSTTGTTEPTTTMEIVQSTIKVKPQEDSHKACYINFQVIDASKEPNFDHYTVKNVKNANRCARFCFVGLCTRALYSPSTNECRLGRERKEQCTQDDNVFGYNGNEDVILQCFRCNPRPKTVAVATVTEASTDNASSTPGHVSDENGTSAETTESTTESTQTSTESSTTPSSENAETPESLTNGESFQGEEETTSTPVDSAPPSSESKDVEPVVASKVEMAMDKQGIKTTQRKHCVIKFQARPLSERPDTLKANFELDVPVDSIELCATRCYQDGCSGARYEPSERKCTLSYDDPQFCARGNVFIHYEAKETTWLHCVNCYTVKPEDIDEVRTGTAAPTETSTSSGVGSSSTTEKPITITTAASNDAAKEPEFQQGCLIKFQARPLSERPKELSAKFETELKVPSVEICATRCYQDGCSGARYDPVWSTCSLSYDEKHYCARGDVFLQYMAKEVTWIHCVNCYAVKPTDKVVPPVTHHPVEMTTVMMTTTTTEPSTNPWGEPVKITTEGEKTEEPMTTTPSSVGGDDDDGLLKGCVVHFQSQPISERPSEFNAQFELKLNVPTIEICAHRCYQDGCTAARFDPETSECSLAYEDKPYCNKGKIYNVKKSGDVEWIHCLSCVPLKKSVVSENNDENAAETSGEEAEPSISTTEGEQATSTEKTASEGSGEEAVTVAVVPVDQSNDEKTTESSGEDSATTEPSASSTEGSGEEGTTAASTPSEGSGEEAAATSTTPSEGSGEEAVTVAVVPVDQSNDEKTTESSGEESATTEPSASSTERSGEERSTAASTPSEESGEEAVTVSVVPVDQSNDGKTTVAVKETATSAPEDSTDMPAFVTDDGNVNSDLSTTTVPSADNIINKTAGAIPDNEDDDIKLAAELGKQFAKDLAHLADSENDKVDDTANSTDSSTESVFSDGNNSTSIIKNEEESGKAAESTDTDNTTEKPAFVVGTSSEEDDEENTSTKSETTTKSPKSSPESSDDDDDDTDNDATSGILTGINDTLFNKTLLGDTHRPNLPSSVGFVPASEPQPKNKSDEDDDDSDGETSNDYEDEAKKANSTSTEKPSSTSTTTISSTTTVAEETTTAMRTTTEPPVQLVKDLIDALAAGGLDFVLGKPRKPASKEAQELINKKLESDGNAHDITSFSMDSAPETAENVPIHQGKSSKCNGRVEFQVIPVASLPKLNITNDVPASSPADCARKCFESEHCKTAGFIPSPSGSIAQGVCLLTSDDVVCGNLADFVPQHAALHPFVVSCIQCTDCVYNIRPVTPTRTLPPLKLHEKANNVQKCAQLCADVNCTMAKYDTNTNICSMTKEALPEDTCTPEVATQINDSLLPISLECVKCAQS